MCNIDVDENVKISKVGLIFLYKVRRKLEKKCARYFLQNNIDRKAIPILKRTSLIPLNNIKTINDRKNYFQLISPCAVIIHKSEGATYDENIYEYDKANGIQFVYIVLSRVRVFINGPFITTKDNS